MPQRRTSLLTHFRNVLCYLFLIVATLCEAYSALAIALDRFVPRWYSTLGWLFLTVPCALVVGLLLMYANRTRLAFYLIASSLSLYAMLICLDDYQGPAGRCDWMFAIGSVAFCALGVLAARAVSRQLSAKGAAAQEYSS